MTTEKKQRGRPRKPKSEKAEQFSIRLPSMQKNALEMLSRMQSVSISQAVELLVTQQINNYKLSGDGLLDIYRKNFQQIIIEINNFAKSMRKTAGDTAALEWIVAKHIHLQQSEEGKVLCFPRELLEPSEIFYRDIVDRLTQKSVSALTLADLFEMSRAMFYTQVPVEQAIEVALRLESDYLQGNVDNINLVTPEDFKDEIQQARIAISNEIRKEKSTKWVDDGLKSLGPFDKKK